MRSKILDTLSPKLKAIAEDRVLIRSGLSETLRSGISYAVKNAPIDTSTLIKSIDYRVGKNNTGFLILANPGRKNPNAIGKAFNYGALMHQVLPGYNGSLLAEKVRRKGKDPNFMFTSRDMMKREFGKNVFAKIIKILGKTNR